jgi:ATP-binding cassette subfamily D (ALD) long-chain fatty acid import protein
MTADITKFADAFSCLYSNLGKPLLDIVIFNYQLARSVGAYGTFGLFLNYMVTANILKRVIPSFGKLVAEEARLEVMVTMN